MMVAHYPLGFGTIVDGKALDYGPNLHDATVIGAVQSSLGQNGSLAFDGNDYIDLGNPSHLQITESLTVSAWVRPSTEKSYFGIVSKCSYYGQNPGMFGWMLYRGETGGVELSRQFRFTLSNGWPPYYTHSDVNHPDTVPKWRHVAGVYYNNRAEVFVDGVIIGSRTLEVLLADNGGKAFIGRQYAEHKYNVLGFFKGHIAEVKIWNYALDDEAIAYQYAIGDYD